MNTDITLPANYSFRSIEGSDMVAIIEMTARAVEADRTDGPATEDKLAQIFKILGERIETNTLAAVSGEGILAALALVLVRPAEDELLAMLDGNVHVEHRGRGLGSYILHWMEQRAREEHEQMGVGLPLVMRTSCADHLADRISLFEQNGFQAERYAYEMQRDLTQPFPEKELPETLRLVMWSQALDDDLPQAFNTAFRGSWGVPEMDEQLWPQVFTGVAQFRGDLSFLVMDGDEIAGFCINWVNEAKNEQRGVQEGWIEALGVIPEWRGQGLATALLAHSMNAFLTAGLEQAALDVDTQNPTGALRLYENMGFKAIKRTVMFTKVIN
jgi:GNAT superfamily N-acetyltransferase